MGSGISPSPQPSPAGRGGRRSPGDEMENDDGAIMDLGGARFHLDQAPWTTKGFRAVVSGTPGSGGGPPAGAGIRGGGPGR